MVRTAAILLLCAVACAQTTLPAETGGPWHILARDQKAILTSPLHIARKDWKWVLPAAGTFAWLLYSDERNMRERLHAGPFAQDRSVAISNAGLGALVTLPVYLYWRGWHRADDDARDTGILAGRAVTDSLFVAGLLRVATDRERPGQNGGDGRFFHGEVGSSGFPSLHSAAAWSIASVVARRYPGWLSVAGVYTAAAAVSAGRIVGREHFPSDVVAGSLLGLLVGRFVSRPPVAEGASPSEHSAAPEGAAYVPLDSWIYSALDRLAALGLIPSQTSGLRPWTRAECRRQMLEADERSARAGNQILVLLRRAPRRARPLPAPPSRSTPYMSGAAPSPAPC